MTGRSRTYYVEVPQRSVQTYAVEASTLAEAKALVNARDPSIEGIDSEVVWSGRAGRGYLDRSTDHASDQTPPTHDGPCTRSLDGDGKPLHYCAECYQDMP